MTLRILHLEDNPADAELVRRVLMRAQLPAQVENVDTAEAYRAALQRASYDVILSDSGIPGYDGRAALEHAAHSRPGTPFIVVSGGVERTTLNSAGLALAGTAAAHVSKSQLDQLPGVIHSSLLSRREAATKSTSAPMQIKDTQYLIAVIQALSLARDLQTVMDIVRHAARKLVNADGATFVLRDGEQCYYAEEDAVEPLWKGQRFPLSRCVSGWTMLNRRAAAISDIYQDARVPHDAYRPTFVKSLLMTPIRTAAPVGAIGVYWASPHEVSRADTELMIALADSTSLAMESVELIGNLERRVAERTAEVRQRQIELDVVNQELEAFSYSVAHDLRSPLITIEGFSQLLLETCSDDLTEDARSYLGHISHATTRMAGLIGDLLALSKIVRAPMDRTALDLAAMATAIAAGLAAQEAPDRQVAFSAAPALAYGDAGMLRTVLENLLANAWKFTSKTAMAKIEFGVHECGSPLATFFLRDNGAGFDPRYADKLFSPFHRLHTPDQFPGTGIGLATVRRIINRHGGEIRAEGAVDHGATFYFSLPSASV